MQPSRLTPYLRPGLALVVGLLGVLLCWAYNPDPASDLVDLSWSFNAARDLLAGRDPYRHTPETNLIPYPLPAALVVLPFALIPGNSGIFLFFGLSSALLAYGTLRDGQYWRLLMFVGPGFVMAAFGKQWSPLMMAGLFYPWLSFVLVAKPTLAPPVVLTARWSRMNFALAAAVGLGLVAAAFLIMPDWPWRWLAQVGQYSGFVPLLTFLGPALALALLRVRERRARLLLLMALVPQQHYFYDQLLLWAIPQNARQMLLLNIAGWAALLAAWFILGTLFGSTNYVLLGVYMPTLLLVLFTRQEPAIPQPRAAPAAESPSAPRS